MDAFLIHEACSGFGTNELQIAQVMTGRTKKHLDRIDQIYRENYERTLQDQLEGELSGHLKDFLVFLQMKEAEFDAHIMKEAVDGIGTDEERILEILTTRGPTRINNMTFRLAA